MKYLLTLLCLQSFLIGVLSVHFETGDAKEGLTDSTLRPAERACNMYRNMPESRILGGTAAAPGEFPWMAALFYIRKYSLYFGCGGTIISPWFILTAASCLRRIKPPVLVRLGKTTLIDDENDNMQAAYYQIEEVIRHYSSLPGQNDIGLLRLVETIRFTNDISPACLNADISDLGDLIATGWGAIQDDSVAISKNLMKTQLKTMPLSQCKSTMLNYSGLFHFRNGIRDGHYCAYDPEGKNDTCQGDGGGPLQYFPTNEPKIAVIVGISSFGTGCGTKSPSFYTRVAYYLDWIETIVWPADQ